MMWILSKKHILLSIFEAQSRSDEVDKGATSGGVRTGKIRATRQISNSALILFVAFPQFRRLPLRFSVIWLGRGGRPVDAMFL